MRGVPRSRLVDGVPADVSVDVTITVDDLAALAAALQEPDAANVQRWFWRGQIAIFAVLLIASALEPIVLVAVAVQVVLFVLLLRRPRKPARAPSTMFLSGRYSLEPRGIRRAARTTETFVAWEAFTAVSRTGSHLLMRFGDGSGWVIPMRCFDSDPHRDAFVAEVVRFAARARQPAP